MSAGTAHTSADRLGNGLGWLSLALGATLLLAPNRAGSAIGLAGKAALLRTYGAREIVTGLGLIAARDKTVWAWARVGGDALDAATLASALRLDPDRRARATWALAAVAGIALLDVACARTLEADRQPRHRAPRSYADRSGFPRGVDAARGIARDAARPDDTRIPEAMRPFKVPTEAPAEARVT